MGNEQLTIDTDAAKKILRLDAIERRARGYGANAKTIHRAMRAARLEVAAYNRV